MKLRGNDADKLATPKSRFNTRKSEFYSSPRTLTLIKQQLYDGLNLRMEDLNVEDLLDDINTDVMTPAWVCFDHDPAEIAKNAYAGLMHNGLRVFRENALKNGEFRGHRLRTTQGDWILSAKPLRSANAGPESTS